MDRLSALSRGTQLMLGAGVLLLIDSFLNWQSVDLGVISFGQSAWHGFLGVVMGLALIVLLAWIVARIAGVTLSLPVSETLIAAALAAIVLVFAVIKNLDDNYSTFWSYLGIVLAAVVAFGAWLQVQAAGGVDTLRSEVTSMTSSAPAPPSEPAAPPPPTTQAPPPPSEPSSPPPGEGPTASSDPSN